MAYQINGSGLFLQQFVQANFKETPQFWITGPREGNHKFIHTMNSHDLLTKKKVSELNLRIDCLTWNNLLS